jgi:hypothetical protein
MDQHERDHPKLTLDGASTENGEGDAPPDAMATQSRSPAAVTTDGETSDGTKAGRPRRGRIQRSFPAVPFEEALELPLAIQRHASGMKIRRVRLFELIGRSPESGPSRQLVTNSGRYGLTRRSYSSERMAY